MTDTRKSHQEIATKAAEYALQSSSGAGKDSTAELTVAFVVECLDTASTKTLPTNCASVVALGYAAGYVQAVQEISPQQATVNGKPWITHVLDLLGSKTNEGIIAAIERMKREHAEQLASCQESERSVCDHTKQLENEIATLVRQRDERTKEWMSAQTALDAEKESHRKTTFELGLAKGTIAANRGIVLDELRTLQNRIALQPPIVDRDTIVVWVEKTIKRLASDEPKNIGIVKPPPPPPAAPAADELSTEIDDELAQAAAHYVNVETRDDDIPSDLERVRESLSMTDDDLDLPWSSRSRAFVNGARWQLVQIENARAGDDPTMHHPPVSTAPAVITDEIAWARAKVLAKLKLEWVRDAVVKMKRLMSEVHTGKVMTIEFHETIRVIDKAIDEQVGAEPNAIAAEHRWMRLHALRSGAVFETTDGIRAAKLNCQAGGAAECITLRNGEYVRFGGTVEEHGNVLVREIVIPDRQAPPGTLGAVRTVLVDLAERMGDHSLNVEMTQEHLIGKIIEFVDYLREYQPITPKIEPTSLKDAPAQADDGEQIPEPSTNSTTTDPIEDELLERAAEYANEKSHFGKGELDLDLARAAISGNPRAHAETWNRDVCAFMAGAWAWQKICPTAEAATDFVVEPRRDYSLAPTPIVFRDDNEREYWDEMTFMLARKGDTTAQSVTGAADEMIEERRARQPANMNRQEVANNELLNEAHNMWSAFKNYTGNIEGPGANNLVSAHHALEALLSRLKHKT
jgi:hypothetical protein